MIIPILWEIEHNLPQCIELEINQQLFSINDREKDKAIQLTWILYQNKHSFIPKLDYKQFEKQEKMSFIDTVRKVRF